MKENVTHLLEENTRLGSPVHISICLRPPTGRLAEVMRDPDFQPILKHNPTVDFAWSYRSVGGRITRKASGSDAVQEAPAKKETCGSLYNGAMVLVDGTVVACACIAAMDAIPDLHIGNVLENDLLEIYTSELTRQFANSSATQARSIPRAQIAMPTRIVSSTERKKAGSGPSSIESAEGSSLQTCR